VSNEYASDDDSETGYPVPNMPIGGPKLSNLVSSQSYQLIDKQPADEGKARANDDLCEVLKRCRVLFLFSRE
jgi:hypothetical protein